MTNLREAAQMALDWADNNGEAVFAVGGWDAVRLLNKWAQPLRAALATEQEPYCYTWDKWISGGNWQAQYGWEPYCGGKRPAHSTEAKPLYTAPPQRKFIGLTDEEIEDACWTEVDQRMRSFARAIEAKLREKNHG